MLITSMEHIVFCRNCGTEATSDAKFCSQCGTPTVSDESPNCSQTPTKISPKSACETISTFHARSTTNQVHPSFINQLWIGNVSLPFSYWICVTIGPNVAFFLSFFLAMSLGNINLFYFCYFIIGAFQFIAMIGTWRAASKYNGPKVWSILARIMIAIGLLSFVLGAMKIMLD